MTTTEDVTAVFDEDVFCEECDHRTRYFDEFENPVSGCRVLDDNLDTRLCVGLDCATPDVDDEDIISVVPVLEMDHEDD